jgi:hypothetical protein
MKIHINALWRYSTVQTIENDRQLHDGVAQHAPSNSSSPWLVYSSVAYQHLVEPWTSHSRWSIHAAHRGLNRAMERDASQIA